MNYCEDCGIPLDTDSVIELKYDVALDADDGYGSYFSVYLCRQCAYGQHWLAIPEKKAMNTESSSSFHLAGLPV